ncbi:MAG: flavodoxin [Asgard group archaeon]|nr:flavodoxin [Asgard group archaeon]
MGMKILVTYYSRSGNTKKIAEAIYNVIKNQKELLAIEQVKEVEQYDLLFIGTPIEKHGPVKSVVEFIRDKITDQQIAIFFTHAAAEHMEFVSMYRNKCIQLINNSNKLLGIFNCQGELSEEVADFMIQSENSQLQQFARMRQYTLNQPDAERLIKAQEFAKKILIQSKSYNKSQKLKDERR